MNVWGSFRDPAGQVFSHQGVVLREIRQVHREEYDVLMASGLYENLVGQGLMVGHEEVAGCPPCSDATYKILRPEQIPFVS